MSTIKTDSTLYRHRRTDGLYRARHAGLAKLGAHQQGEGWVEAIFYQSAEKPSSWFCRDLKSFQEGFVEEREYQIAVTLGHLELPADLPRAYMANWFQGTDNGHPVVFGDLVDAEDERTLQQDAKTGPVQHIDTDNRFVVTSDKVYELVGEEVAILTTRG